LSDDDVREVRQMLARGYKPEGIASKFGVAASVVYRIRRGVRYKGVGLIAKGANDA
jgi:transposase